MTDRKKLSAEEEEVALYFSKAIWLIVLLIFMFGGIYFISH